MRLGKGVEYMKQRVVFATYVVTMIMLEAATCRFSLYPITMFLGFFFGWTLVTNMYPAVDGKMTLRGDFVLAATVIGVILVTTFSAELLCRIPAGTVSCTANISEIRVICTFAFAMSVGISSFTLWLWFRIRQLRDTS
jgi:uncharacterized Tic20 family protein